MICITLICICGCDCISKDSAKQKIAPDFRLEDTDHQRFYLNQYQGRIVVIVFWSTWCIVCKRYLNELEEANAGFEDKGIKLVSILIDPENSDTLSEILKDSVHINYPVLLDRNMTVMKRFNVKDMPTTIIIGKDGEIVMEKVGYNLSTITQIGNRLDMLMENQE